MALKSQGVLVQAGDTTAGGTYVTIPGVISVSGPGGSAAVIDATDLDSTAKEKLIGLQDEGQLQMTAHFTPGNAMDTQLRADRAAATSRFYQITFTDSVPSTAEFNAFVLQYQLGLGVDDKITLNVTLEISGAITWTVS